MKILDNLLSNMGYTKKMVDPSDAVERSITDLNSGVFPYANNVANFNTDRAMLLSAVYRCVEVISDSVAQLPCEPFFVDSKGNKKKAVNHPTYKLLNEEPNDVMSRYTFNKLMVTSMLLNGNAYALIERDKMGNAIKLTYLQPEWVTVETNQFKTSVRYKVEGIRKPVESVNMIHLINYSYDGIVGISTLQHAANTLKLARAAEKSAMDFYASGCNTSGILKSLTPQTEEQKNTAKNKWINAHNGIDANGIVVLSGGWDYTPISVDPASAQMLESRQYSVIDICRFFGVNPVKVFDLTHSSYSTVEATQLSFLTDTLAPLIEKFELEYKRKLYRPSEKQNIKIEFDTNMLLKADKSAQATYYNTLYNIGAITPNEIRKENNLPAMKGGDKLMTQVNMTTLESLEKQAEAPVEPVVESNNELNNNKPIEDGNRDKVDEPANND